MKKFIACGLLAILLGTLWARPILAQSRLFPTNQSGFDLDGGLSGAEDDDEMAYGLDLTFLFDENVFITPSYQSLGGEKSMGVSLGFLIPGT
jgi:hypothetical protein